MEYERIDKVQTGIISPSKLRMKLMGSPKKRDGSNSNSSRTSPVRMEDSEFLKNSLLASTTEDFGNEGHSLDISSVTICSQTVSKENSNVSHDMTHQSNSTANSSAVHPLKYMEDENLDYDSNASSSSFEFHKGERAVRSLTRSFSRPTSYKWNDAEKWIMNKQSAQSNHLRAHSVSSQGNRMPVMNMVRVAPETAGYDLRLQSRLMDMKRIDLGQPQNQMILERFSFGSAGALSNTNPNLCPQTRDLKEIIHTKDLEDDTSETPAIRAVSMRDMGTEMTPIPSQEPSRTGTPIGATTPIRSPTSSLPSTPRRVDAATEIHRRSQDNSENGRKGLSYDELNKLKTRREIVALGVQLGKMNIAAWASKDEQEKGFQDGVNSDPKELERLEFEQRAASWEEAEKSKQAASFKREEIKILAWESQKKLKLEAEMRRMEAKFEEMRSCGQAKMMKKIAKARKQSDEKRAAAEARRNRQAERIAAQAESIRQTGRIPPLDYLCCWLF
ncbi:hypothetical protein V2J09_010202 [Rumex salicifolius]